MLFTTELFINIIDNNKDNLKKGCEAYIFENHTLILLVSI